MGYDKIFGVLSCVLFVFAFSAVASAEISVDISVSPEFFQDEYVKFSYTILSDQDVSIVYVPSVICENNPEPLMVDTPQELKQNVPVEKEYIYGMVDDNMKSSRCAASVEIIQPERKMFSEEFAISASDKIKLELKICRDQGCNNKAAAFTLGETVYFDYDSPESGLSFSATLTKPAGSEDVVIPSSFQPDAEGNYRIRVTASKPGYSDVSVEREFIVTETGGSIEQVQTCVPNGRCEGQENYNNCPQDCMQPMMKFGYEEMVGLISVGVIIVVIIFVIVMFMRMRGSSSSYGGNY